MEPASVSTSTPVILTRRSLKNLRDAEEIARDMDPIDRPASLSTDRSRGGPFMKQIFKCQHHRDVYTRPTVAQLSLRPGPGWRNMESEPRRAHDSKWS